MPEGTEMTINFKTAEKEEYTIIHFELKESITPEALKNMEPPRVNGRKGVVLSGRGPIWLYCFLTHYYHPTKFIATYDPRLGGAVIVESHSSQHKIGETLKIEIPDKIQNNIKST